MCLHGVDLGNSKQLRARKIHVDHCQAKKSQQKMCSPHSSLDAKRFDLHPWPLGPIPEALGQLPFVKLQLLGDADG